MVELVQLVDPNNLLNLKSKIINLQFCMLLPKFLKPYFWDVGFNQLDPKKSNKFIATRILELGDEKATRWLLGSYTRKLFKDILENSRELSPKSANFWSIYFNLDQNKVKCLQKPYLQQRQKVWPY